MKKEDTLIIALTGKDSKTGPARSLLRDDLNWDYIISTAARNRLDALLYHSLDQLKFFDQLPSPIQREFEDRYRRTVLNTEVYLEIAGRLARDFAREKIDLVVLRGLSLGMAVYGKPYLRPFSDLDLLIRKKDILPAAAILRKAGFAGLPGTLPPNYFLKYHLHLSFKDRERGAIAELHWALDHPYTLYAVDYDSLLSRKREAEFRGIRIPVLTPEDNLLALSLHLRKHCQFLPALREEEDFLSLLLAGRLGIWIEDIHRLLLRRGEDLDWEEIRKKADAWNLEEEVDSCLRTVSDICHLTLPPGWKHPRRPRRMNLAERKIYQSQLSLLRGGEKTRRSARFLFRLRADAIFRPARSLDALRYIFPPAGYIRKRYRIRGALLFYYYPRHAGRAILQLIGNLLKLIYYRII